MSTDEVADLYADNPDVFGSGFTNKDLDGITDENLSSHLQIQPVNAKGLLWVELPWYFCRIMAFCNGLFTRGGFQEQLESVFFKVMGDAG